MKIIVRSTAPMLCAVGLALSDPASLGAAEQANSPTTGTYGSGKNYRTTVEQRNEGELTPEDVHQASLLSTQMLVHLNAAALQCVDGKGDGAKSEIEKAQSLVGIVRKLLPTTIVTTIVKDAQGKEVYRDVQRVQDDQIPIFSDEIVVKVVEPLVEAKKHHATVKGLTLVDADVIHTAVLADLGYIERKLARAAQLLNKPEDAAAELALAQVGGIRFATHKEHSMLSDVQHALRHAEHMVQEKNYDGAKANLQTAKLRLEAYRGLVGKNEAAQAADLEKEIEKISGELDKPGVTEKIRGMWDKASSWFKRERETAPAEKKEAKP